MYRERQVYAWTARISELQVILGMFSPVEHPQAATPFCRGLSACGHMKASGMSGTRNIIPLRTDPCPRMNDGSIVAGSRRTRSGFGRTDCDAAGPRSELYHVINPEERSGEVRDDHRADSRTDSNKSPMCKNCRRKTLCLSALRLQYHPHARAPRFVAPLLYRTRILSYSMRNGSKPWHPGRARVEGFRCEMYAFPMEYKHTSP